MLTYSDCVGFSELTPEEIAVIAQHEHLPDIVALEMGVVLHGTAAGRQLIRRMIIETSEAACRRGTREPLHSWGWCCTTLSIPTSIGVRQRSRAAERMPRHRR